MVSFDINNILYSLSTALDIVEKTLLGATTNHAKRVAFISIKMGKMLNLNPNELSSLAVAATLHDSALTEYIHEEMEGKVDPNKTIVTAVHCEIGEENISGLNLDSIAKDSVLYHHEQANGGGPFGKTADKTPLGAQIIHIADQIDVAFPLKNMNKEKYLQMREYLDDNSGVIFSPEMVVIFNESITDHIIDLLSDETIDTMLFNECPHYIHSYPAETLKYIADLFAKIIDYKSPFTSMHSAGIAKKASKMGQYYGLSETLRYKLYFAGAVHDIGKLTIDNSLLGKPRKLTESEFNTVKDHAIASYNILRSINGLEDACEWAYSHHEKLDGSGYPLGLSGDKLNRFDRLLCCIDIYQALTEDRPYRKNLSHQEAISIMNDMVSNGKIDKEITKDIELCFA